MRQVKLAGYTGIEYAIANDVSEENLDYVWQLAERYQLKLIPQHFETGDVNFDRHQEKFESWFAKIKNYPAAKINSQTGVDHFTFEQNVKLLDFASSFERETGINVYHETSRKKCLFAAHIAKEYLAKIPDLKVTLDVSHWVCVAESYLEDQFEALDAAIERAGHIHARIGFPEGPQISDPRAPEWKRAIDSHLNWWRSIARRHECAGEVLTITPEFGPAPYMWLWPYSQQALVSQWDVNLHMKSLIIEDFFTN